MKNFQTPVRNYRKINSKNPFSPIEKLMEKTKRSMRSYQ